jgi:hypothetical protein
MKLDAGTIVTIVAVLLFYLRLIGLQRNRIKKAQHQYAEVSSRNAKKKSAGDKKPELRYARLGVNIRNWWMVVPGILLITFGAAIAATTMFGTYSSYWWVPVIIGIALFGFGLG